MKKPFCPTCGSSLHPKIIEGKERSYCPVCQTPIFENPVPATAAVVINAVNEILLVKRKVSPGHGLWCLPGGFMEIGESPEECVIRELYEETSLSGNIASFYGIEMSYNGVYPAVMVLVYSFDRIEGTPQAGDDAEECAYFPFDHLPEIAFLSHRRIIERIPPLRFSLHSPWGAYVITSGDHLKIAEEAYRAGARIIQYRDKKSSLEEKLRIARKIHAMTRENRTLMIVNDHIDLAVLAGADGVHLGQEDLPISEARKLLPSSCFVGRSTHSLAQAVQAQQEGADYIAIGPVFPTPTKADYPPIGLATVEQVIRTISIPVVAIGGIDLNNISQLTRIGVKNIAMVRQFQQQTGTVVNEVNRLLFSGSGNDSSA